MVVDTSVFVAILDDEPEADAFAAVLRSMHDLMISAFTLFECRTILHRRYPPRSCGRAIAR